MVKYGVLLMAFGGPDKPEAIEPFVTSLLGGKILPPPVMEKIKQRYHLIGGSSPLVRTTQLQADQLQSLLGGDIAVEIGMRHTQPTIEQGIRTLVNQAVTKIIAVSLSPHYSRVSTGAYQQEARRVVESFQPQVELMFAGGWYDHPLVIEAFYRRIQEALEQFPEMDRKGVEIIFSAHSLPKHYIAEGEPYAQELNATIEALTTKLSHYPWQLAYQSKGGGKGEWLGPEVEQVLAQLAAKGKHNVLVAPLSFASDHVETLYDIDILIKKQAQQLSINLQRSQALNAEEKFIEALAAVVNETIATS